MSSVLNSRDASDAPAGTLAEGVVALAAAAALPLLTPRFVGTPLALVVAAGLVAAMVAVAWRGRVRAAVVIAAGLAVVALINLAFPSSVALGIAAAEGLIVAAVLWRSPPLRRFTPWLRRGHPTPELPVLLAVLPLLSGGALTAWALLIGNDPPDYYLDLLRGTALPVVLLLGVVFSLVNATVEEVLFRGVLMEALLTPLSATAAVVAQAVSFSLYHLDGFPAGLIGVVMAGSWGAVLGVIRLRTRGLLYVLIAHVLADASIFVLALSLYR